MIYESQSIVLDFEAAVASYSAGDTARAFSNSGSGDIDWDTAISPHTALVAPEYEISASKYQCQIETKIQAPGLWAFGLLTYDSYGNNAGTGTPGEVEIYLTPRPYPPLKMVPASYDDATDILVMTLY